MSGVQNKWGIGKKQQAEISSKWYTCREFKKKKFKIAVSKWLKNQEQTQGK